MYVYIIFLYNSSCAEKPARTCTVHTIGRHLQSCAKEVDLDLIKCVSSIKFCALREHFCYVHPLMWSALTCEPYDSQ